MPEIPKLSTEVHILLATAKKESLLARSAYVGSEHLLLAALRETVPPQNNILFSTGLSVDEIRLYLQTKDFTTEDADAEYDRAARNVFAGMLDLAKRHGHSEVRPEHLILSLLNQPAGGALEVLRHFKVDVKHIKQVLSQLLSSQL